MSRPERSNPVALLELPARMARKKTQTNGRDTVIVLKDSEEYREWFAGLSEATLIPGATIVRDALAKWAADRGLPPPPSGPIRPKGRPKKHR